MGSYLPKLHKNEMQRQELTSGQARTSLCLVSSPMNLILRSSPQAIHLPGECATCLDTIAEAGVSDIWIQPAEAQRPAVLSLAILKRAEN